MCPVAFEISATTSAFPRLGGAQSSTGNYPKMTTSKSLKFSWRRDLDLTCVLSGREFGDFLLGFMALLGNFIVVIISHCVQDVFWVYN